MDLEGEAILNMQSAGLDKWTITFDKGRLYLQAEIPKTSLIETRKVDNIQFFKTKPITINPAHYILFVKMLEYASITHQMAIQSNVPPNLAEMSPDQKREFIRSLPLNKRQELVAHCEEMVRYVEELGDT